MKITTQTRNNDRRFCRFQELIHIVFLHIVLKKLPIVLEAFLGNTIRAEGFKISAQLPVNGVAQKTTGAKD
jgi:hypothetical protein